MAEQEDINQVDELSTEQETDQVVHHNGEMTNRVARLEENSAVLSLLSDPDVRAVVEAKRAGKRVKVAEDVEQQETQAEVSLTEGLEADDPTRPVLEKLDKMIESRMKKITDENDTLRQRLASVEGLANEVQARDVKEQVERTQAKYKDFGLYKESMVKLSQSNPTLKVDDLYILAKHRSGKLKMVEQATQTERPTNVPPRTARDPKAPARPSGKKGFTELLADRLQKLDLNLDS